MKRLLYLMLSLALLVVGCSKDNDELDAATKTTTYTFGPRWYDQIRNIDQIKASADSVQVGKIIFQATNLSETGDSIYGWKGCNMMGLHNVLMPAMNASKNKGECRGTLKQVNNSDLNREYAPKLEALGLKIIFSKDFTETVLGIDLDMAYVEGGTFRMGATEEQGSDAYDNEKPIHQVTLSDYYIGRFEVTQESWEKVMGTTIRQQRDKANSSWSLYGEGSDYPMYYVNWDEAQEFCRKLSQLTGKTYVLPTEAQWEYAARGGVKSRGYKYSGSDYIGGVAWYSSNSSSSTHPVKGLLLNELGLRGMSGNVWEWCSDWYGSYSNELQSNPTGPSTGSYRVIRGGGWGDDARGCRVSNRGWDDPDLRHYSLGFRVVCLP